MTEQEQQIVNVLRDFYEPVKSATAKPTRSDYLIMLAQMEKLREVMSPIFESATDDNADELISDELLAEVLKVIPKAARIPLIVGAPNVILQGMGNLFAGDNF